MVNRGDIIEVEYGSIKIDACVCQNVIYWQLNISIIIS